MVFTEMVKLLKIVVTLPVATVEKRNVLPYIKLGKNMFMNNMGQDRLNAVAVLSTARHTECSSNVANSKTLYQLNT
jgi:hypothetical protein